MIEMNIRCLEFEDISQENNCVNDIFNEYLLKDKKHFKIEQKFIFKTK